MIAVMWAQNGTDSREIVENLTDQFQLEIQTSSKIRKFGGCHLLERFFSNFWSKFAHFFASAIRKEPAVASILSC